MRKFVNQWGVYIVDLGCKDGSVQNAIGNACSPTTICLPITSKTKKSKIPPHYLLYRHNYSFFDCDENIVLCEQVCTIDVEKQVQKYLVKIKDEDKNKIFMSFLQNFHKEEEKDCRN